MTVTKVNIEEVKSSMDAYLEVLHKELRELNHQVREGLLFYNIKTNADAVVGKTDLVKPRACL